MSEDEWNVGSCRGVLTPPSAPPWPFPHLLTVTIYVWLGHPRHRTSKRDISSWNFDISPNGIRAGWRFLLLSMTLACVLLFQITSSVRHGCRRPTAAPRGGWWLDNLVTGMGWNWQNRWLAPILWTRDWPFPAQCSGSKSEKQVRRGIETEPSIPLITSSYVEGPHLPRLRLPSCENSLDHETWKTLTLLTAAKPACVALMWAAMFFSIRYSLLPCI